MINKYIKNYIIICSDKNNDAKKAITKLKKQGIEKIFVLKEGINAWKNAGFPLIKNKNKKFLNK
jgi:rhodanese-related sulfurtransferase